MLLLGVYLHNLRKGERTATMDWNLETVTDVGARWFKQIPGEFQFVFKALQTMTLVSPLQIHILGASKVPEQSIN